MSNIYYNEEENYNYKNELNQLPNQKIQEFVGIVGNKQGWTNCFYCEKTHPQSMYLPGLEYCIHCWGVLNTNQLDLEKGIYTGENSIHDIKNYLKETLKLHESIKCINSDCIYNKINKFEKQKKLHKDFCVEFGFVIKEKQLLTKSTNKSNVSGYKISDKSNSRINYKLSHITI